MMRGTVLLIVGVVSLCLTEVLVAEPCTEDHELRHGLRELLTKTGVLKGTDCPDKWIAFQGSCYHFGYTTLTFAEAKLVCEKNHGSHLVNVGDANENSFIREHLGHLSPRQNYWVGMTDKGVEGVWKWDNTGAVVTFTDWIKGQPDNWQTGEDCAQFYQANAFHWNDVKCDLKHAPICEISGNDMGTWGRK